MNLDRITAQLMSAAFGSMLYGAIFTHGNWLATAFAFTGMAFAWRCVK